MELSIRARHLDLTPEASQELRDRVYATLSRIRSLIRAVDVTITDVNGPKGGADKLCRVRVSGRAMPSVVVEQLGVDTFATVALALIRAEQATVRKLARRRVFAPTLAPRADGSREGHH